MITHMVIDSVRCLTPTASHDDIDVNNGHDPIHKIDKIDVQGYQEVDDNDDAPHTMTTMPRHTTMPTDSRDTSPTTRQNRTHPTERMNGKLEATLQQIKEHRTTCNQEHQLANNLKMRWMLHTRGSCTTRQCNYYRTY
jgi:hypothetical protein